MDKKLNRRAVIMLVLSVTTALGITMWLSFTTAFLPAYAQDEGNAPQVELLNSTGEGQNRVLTSGSRALAPNEQHVYRFDYDGNEQPIRVWMSVTPANSAQFQIWTDDKYLALETQPDLEPLAVGAPLTDAAEFLLWESSSPEPETYYVVIATTENAGGVTPQYLLNISSLGLSAAQSGIVQPTPVPTPIPPTAVPAQEVAPPTVDPNLPTPAAIATAAGIVDTHDASVAVVTTAMLNVRTGPSTAYMVITAVPRGTILTVLGRDASNTWIAVRLDDGREGWVTRSLTDYVALAVVVLTPEPLPTPTPIPGFTPVPPSTPGPTIIVVDANEPKALDGDWQVLREGETHWYTFQYRGGNLPVHVWMDMEPNGGAVFNILNRETALAVLAGVAPTVVNAIGRGTANPVEPGYSFWLASFPEADIFYVMVQHQGPGNVLYSIHAAGPGLGRPVLQ
ncbi:MAG: SH3 domain-containing protein [Caldilineaceae bacterium]|nr:SH3 domain-containing protein [Caldilineaceae bacterium]